MARKLEPTPAFANEAEEREFWETNDSAEYMDWDKAEPVTLPNLEYKRRDLI